MTVNLEEYKKIHKTEDQKELERLMEIADAAYDEYNAYLNQQELKWKNKPKGSHASPEEVDEMISMMAMLGSACNDVRDQQIKMGLRKDKNKD